MNKIICIISGIIVFFCHACSDGQHPQNRNDAAIDSLIMIKYLNADALMISFGSDAVCAINTSDGIVVIDAGMSKRLTSRYRKIIDKEFGKKKYVYLIVTHGHPDHCGGNSVFPETKVIAHENFFKDISSLPPLEKRKSGLQKVVKQYDERLKNSEAESDEWERNYKGKIIYQSAYEDLSPAEKPHITFKDSLTIESGSTIIKIFWPGTYHSNSDIIIYIPKMNLLFTGDLFFHYGYPGRDEELKIDDLHLKGTTKKIQEKLNGTETFISGHAVILTYSEFCAWTETFGSME